MPRYCQRCVLPETRPGVSLDAECVCQGCRSALQKQTIDWAKRAREFRELVDDTRRRAGSHDCVIPVSGGKDSYWQVVTCLEHGLRPLCVTYVYPGRSELGERNLRRLLQLGVDHVEFRLNPQIERAFIEKAFRKKAISGLVAHAGIFAVPVQEAVARDIPLVVYGENSAFEYGTEDERLTASQMDERWRERFGVTAGTRLEDWIDDELTREQIGPLFAPSDEVLAEKRVRVTFLGHYFPWDPENSLAIAQENGFQRRAAGPRVGHHDFVNIDDDMIGVHHHAKWHKFGITRSWDTMSMDIRNGRLTRDEAISQLRERGEEVPLEDIEIFCKYIGITRPEYFEILEGFRNRDIWSRQDGRWVIEDFLIPDFEWPADVSNS